MTSTRCKHILWRLLWRLTILLAVVVGLTLWPSGPLVAQVTVAGATIVVNSFADEIADDDLCTLREAILAVNRDRAGYGCPSGRGADTILLPPGLYRLARWDGGAAGGDLDIERSLTIQPSAPGLVIVDAAGANSRVFEIEGGDVYLRGLTLRNGRAERGAGILVEGRADLWLDDVTLTGNAATQRGGALLVDDGADVVLRHVTLVDNTAPTGSAIRNGGDIWAINTLIGVHAPADAAACSGDALKGNGPNVVADASCATANTVVAADLGLTAWRDADGVTFWALAAVTSPAYNTGSSAACTATDQLGTPRPQFDQCDIGAHELAQQPPTAAAVDATTPEDTPVTLTLAGSDPNGDALTFSIVQPPAAGTLGPVTSQGPSSATVLYTPPAHFDGVMTFTYAANDGERTSDPATVTVTVTPDAWLEVTTTADAGPGSLRERLNQANANPDLSTILFAIPGQGPYVIALAGALPVVQAPLILDATTQPPGLVVVDGQGGDFPGLVLLPGASGSTIMGLTLRNFGGSCLIAQQSGSHTITGNIFTHCGGDGVTLIGDPANPAAAGGNRVTGNTITDNQGSGISIVDGVRNDLSGNVLAGNGKLPVDLGGDGRTPNDPLDADVGPNDRQNYPVIFRAAPITAGADGVPARLDGWLNSKPGQSYTIRAYVGDSCTGDQHLVTTTPASVPTGDDGTVYFSLVTAEPVVLNQAVRATASDAAGNTSEYSDCVVVGYDNDEWPRALPLSVGSGPAVVRQYLDLAGQARWYRFAVQPNSQVEVLLTELPANYDLTIYKDLAAAYQALAQPQEPNKLSAEFAPSAFSPSAFSPSAFSPSAFSPSAFSPSAFSPSAFSPSAFSPSAFSPLESAPSAFSPSAFSPSAFSPSAFSPSAFSPSAFSPSAFSPSAFSPAAFSGAQTTSLLGVSAFEGTAGEGLAINTWNQSGEFYVRVRGRDGAFNLDAPFKLQVTVRSGPCGDLPADGTLPPASLAAAAGGYKSVILVDAARLRSRYPAGEVDALLGRLAALATRPEVKGVIVDVGGDARVAAANARADQYATCPYAKNVVGEAIRSLVQAYARANPLEYVVLVGDDDIIPFFRYTDNALLGHESNFVPPVRDDSASQASLRLGYVLSQDAYGAATDVTINGAAFPVPGLAVGRLVETPGDMGKLLAAYLATPAGVAPTPQAAFVSGYDFLADAARAIQDELAAGLAQEVDGLIAAPTLSPLDPAAWTADQLRAALAGRRYDIAFLAGHFNAASALAADYKSSFLSTDLLALPVDLTNALFFSAGCHAGYNIVTPHGVPNVTFEPDWAQAFAQRGATLIAGTGYQYGDTDFLEYSERLYLELARQLRTGDGPVAVGKALAAAKQRYLATTPALRGIHEKAVLEATLFGLPMLAVELPGPRLPAGDDASVVSPPQPVAAAPGKVLGLHVADITLTPELTERVVELTGVDGSGKLPARWLAGSDGVVTNPAEPALPLESLNVGVPGLVLRGVGLRGGAYTDVADVLPLTGAAVTELRGVHMPFRPDIWFPPRPWSVNYFAALAGDGAPRLHVTPAQHKTADTGGLTGLRRQFTRMDFRLFYTPASNEVTVAASGQPFLADAPTIVQPQAFVVGGDLIFRVAAVGNPAAGVQGVWVTYTGLQGPWHGAWQSLDLAQSSQDSTLWEGRLPLQGTAPGDVRFIVQAVNGTGLVTLAENLGRYFVPGGDTAPLPTTLELLPPATPVGAYGDSVTLAAVLRDVAGRPVTGQTLVFGVGSQTQSAVTDGQGRGQATLALLGLPGDYLITAAFAGTIAYAPSAATGAAAFTVQRQTAVLALDAAVVEGRTGDTGLLTATLTDAAGRRLPEQSVLFVVEGKQTLTVPAITNLVGQATLGQVTLPPGVYQVSARYGGAVAYTAGTSAASQLLLKPTDPTDDGPIGYLFLPLAQR